MFKKKLVQSFSLLRLKNEDFNWPSSEKKKYADDSGLSVDFVSVSIAW